MADDVVILMQAKRMLLAKIHPIIDRQSGQIQRYATGKIQPGRKFTFRGPLRQAPGPDAATPIREDGSPDGAWVDAIAKSREDHKHAKRLAVQKKKAEGAAMAAQAAAAIFKDTPQAQAAREADQAPPRPRRKPGPKPGTKRKPGRPKGSRNRPKPAPETVTAGVSDADGGE